MEILFLGTAASEGFPNPFCSCENCQEARAEGRKSIRLRSSILINDEILVDFGPDIVSSANRFGKNLSEVKHIFITHSHSDHLFLKNFEYRNPIFSGSFDKLFHVDLIVPNKLGKVLKEAIELPKISLMSVEPYKELHFNGYVIHTIKANHTSNYDETPLNYIFEKDNMKVMYGVDTGKLLPETITYLKEKIKYLDVLILDATMGFNKKYEYHMGYDEVVGTKELLYNEGIIDDNTKVIVTHFSHLHNPKHSILEELYGKHNIIVAFDGLKIMVK
ncbi:MBL fold metallo-hydrolase [Marinitoga litoralis]|uniref:MBL fold metallo-hydrolase n=1 Tax=Marinitoga litoralis TaxID=570855 RepID=UPI001960C0EE|nr:MBL fold metallo-hydrolase [Marinitoga litoralis]MBM7560224.1 phosphoribosyl 1,2-cyclic phosphate phosphodiesterase [Marinitoga litoralis]